MLMWTFCGYKVPYSTLCVRFCPFCAPVAMHFSPRVLAKAKVLQVNATGYPTGKAEEIPVTCRASVQLGNSTPHPDPVKAEMLIPQTPYFTWHLPVLTYLVFAICCSPQMPHADREGRHTLPSPKSTLLTVKHKEKKKKYPLHSHGEEELWLARKCCVQQAHHHNLDRQNWRTDKASST